MQVVRQLVAEGHLSSDQIQEDEDGHISLDIEEDMLREALSSGVAFQVTGCKGCNRPFYNERPRGLMYNYPRCLTEEEVLRAIDDTNLVA
jgi:biotin synthase